MDSLIQKIASHQNGDQNKALETVAEFLNCNERDRNGNFQKSSLRDILLLALDDEDRKMLAEFTNNNRDKFKTPHAQNFLRDFDNDSTFQNLSAARTPQTSSSRKRKVTQREETVISTSSSQTEFKREGFYENEAKERLRTLFPGQYALNAGNQQGSILDLVNKIASHCPHSISNPQYWATYMTCEFLECSTQKILNYKEENHKKNETVYYASNPGMTRSKSRDNIRVSFLNTLYIPHNAVKDLEEFAQINRDDFLHNNQPHQHLIAGNSFLKDYVTTKTAEDKAKVKQAYEKSPYYAPSQHSLASFNLRYNDDKGSNNKLMALLTPANKGFAPSQLLLGVYSEMTQEGPTDKLYKHAAEQNYALAQSQYGRYLLKKQPKQHVEATIIITPIISTRMLFST